MRRGPLKALITGGGGFLGSRLAAALKARDPAAEITLLDVAFPPGLESKHRCIAGDVAAPEVIAKALAQAASIAAAKPRARPGARFIDPRGRPRT